MSEEELDLDVEPFGATTGLQVPAGAEAPALQDRAPAFRLAAAAPAARRVGRLAAIVRATAVLAGVGALAWGTYWLYAPLQRTGKAEPPAASEARPPSPAPRTPWLPSASGRPASGRTAPAAQGPPAASPPGPPPAPRRPARRAPARPRMNPLNEPLPAVNSILVGGDRRIAVLDGRIVEEGDEVGPRVLLRIEPDAVILREPSGYEVRVPVRRGPAGGGPPAFRGRARNCSVRFRAFDV